MVFLVIDRIPRPGFLSGYMYFRRTDGETCKQKLGTGIRGQIPPTPGSVRTRMVAADMVH